MKYSLENRIYFGVSLHYECLNLEGGALHPSNIEDDQTRVGHINYGQ